MEAPTATGAPVRVLIVDDSAVMRRILTRMLSSDTAIEVVGSARDGHEALAEVERLSPDLVTLDVEMPEMDGLKALRAIQTRFPRVRVIMCSSLTERGASITIDALLAGASDYVCKQHSAGLTVDAYEQLRQDLLKKIRYFYQPVRPQREPGAGSPSPLSKPTGLGGAASGVVCKSPIAAATRRTPEVLAIGVSTGGPNALAEVLSALPPDFPLPVAIVQHMPPFFTQLLAERLSRRSAIPVVEGSAAMEFKRGMAVIAPGDFHMRIVRKAGNYAVELNQQNHENSCRPAVDVLFRSIADTYQGAALGVVLTGMGQDGLEGARMLKSRGAPVLVQDSATSVVWGMPGAIARADLADAVLPLQEIIPEVLRRL